MAIGFIGLGIMGSRMAGNLLAAGYDLVVHNRTRSKADPLVQQGARWASSPAETGRQADVLYTMLAHPEAVRQMALGDDGFLNGLPAGSLWVDCSTVNPSFSRQMARAAAARNLRFVDAPVAGTRGPAEHGELLFLVGGADEDLAEIQPHLEAMGRKTVHVGGQGMGTSMKMVINLLLGEAMLAFSEAMVLGESLGIPQETLFSVLVGGPVTAPFISGKKAKIAAGEFQADFPLRWMGKDLHLVAITAYEEGVALPAANVAKEIYTLAARHDMADLDFSAIYRFIHQQSGQQ
jgi:3-hydroxyisobutyrate dehydrogenase-like beta-hydroxyacid dehydrogenase